MYQRHSFGAPPPIFTPPPKPYNPRHHAYTTGKQPANSEANTKTRKDALELHQDGGFPSQLSLAIQTKPQMPILAVDFSEKNAAKHW